MMVEHDSRLSAKYEIDIPAVKQLSTGFYQLNQTHDHSMTKFRIM